MADEDVISSNKPRRSNQAENGERKEGEEDRHSWSLQGIGGVFDVDTGCIGYDTDIGITDGIAEALHGWDGGGYALDLVGGCDQPYRAERDGESKAKDARRHQQHIKDDPSAIAALGTA